MKLTGKLHQPHVLLHEPHATLPSGSGSWTGSATVWHRSRLRRITATVQYIPANIPTADSFTVYTRQNVKCIMHMAEMPPRTKTAT